MIINIFNNYKKKIDFNIKKIIDKFSSYFEESEISVVLVSADEIKNINCQYRNKDTVTDVLSFPCLEYNFIGDIFICIDKVIEQALSYNHSYEREFAFLLTHGILHLKGYDHLNKEDENEMFDLQEKILNDLNYKR